MGSKFGRLYMAELSQSDNHTVLKSTLNNTLVFRARATGPGNNFFTPSKNVSSRKMYCKFRRRITCG